MPKVDVTLFERKPRIDRKPGFQEMVPTKMKYVEADGTDIRVHRVRIYREDGTLEHVCLQDGMGMWFKDLSDIDDDMDYLENLRSRSGKEAK